MVSPEGGRFGRTCARAGRGTGRITIPIAEAGIRITALDLDAGMLEKLRAEGCGAAGRGASRVSVHHGDMRSFTLDDSSRWSSSRSARFFTI